MIIIAHLLSFYIKENEYFCSYKSLLQYNKQEGQDGPVSLIWLPDKFESISLSVQEKKFNIDFQDFQSEQF